MRIFYVPSNISIENLRHIFPHPPRCHSYQNVTSPTPSPKPLYFLAPPPIHSKSTSRTAYQIPKRNAITQTPHQKQAKKSNSNTTAHKSPKKNLQKGNPKQSIKLHQLENTPTQTAIQIQQTPSQIPLRNHTPQNARTFSLKRKCISLQTPKSSLPNASAFHLKHKDVCTQTQARFPPQNLPIILHPASPNAPKSLKTRSPCLQIPPNLSILPPATPSRSLLKGVSSPNPLGNPHKSRIRKTPKSQYKQQKETKPHKSKSTQKSATRPRIPLEQAFVFPLPVLQNARKSLLVP